jgi:hypothetical protein
MAPLEPPATKVVVAAQSAAFTIDVPNTIKLTGSNVIEILARIFFIFFLLCCFKGLEFKQKALSRRGMGTHGNRRPALRTLFRHYLAVCSTPNIRSGRNLARLQMVVHPRYVAQAAAEREPGPFGSRLLPPQGAM